MANPPTPSERLFEAYLYAHGFVFEHDLDWRAHFGVDADTNPDYLVSRALEDLAICEAKERTSTAVDRHLAEHRFGTFDSETVYAPVAQKVEDAAEQLARETYLEAFAAALSADRLVRGGDAREVAAAVLAADWEPSTRACDLLLDGLALLTHEGYVAAVPALKVALRTFRDEPLSEEEELRWLWLACRIARALADDGTWDELTARHLELARRTGAFSLLPVALTDRAVVELFSGRFAVATSLAAESDAVVEATGSHVAQRASIMLANWRGRDAEAVALIEAREQEVLRRGEGLWVVANEWGSAQRYSGRKWTKPSRMVRRSGT